jgi:hypothetical protein
MKLSKLPDRTPVKLTTTLSPQLAARLRDYADYYAETYDTREEVADLVPFMLEAFLDADADFRRASRTGGAKDSSDAAARNPGDRRARRGPEPGGGEPSPRAGT